MPILCSVAIGRYRESGRAAVDQCTSVTMWVPRHSAPRGRGDPVQGKLRVERGAQRTWVWVVDHECGGCILVIRWGILSCGALVYFHPFEHLMFLTRGALEETIDGLG